MEDPAFVWQQQAREARPMPSPAGEAVSGPQRPAASIRWVTLHEAEEVTGVPSSTVRNWARKERIPTRFELAPEGQVRMVDVDAVVARARHLGRLRPPPTIHPGPAPPLPASTAAQSRPEAPEGSVLVPIDAWNKMINQLGNLHEAGQQLAEARERAARAETEASFLRERLAELRRQKEPDEPVPTPIVPEQQATVDAHREIEPAWLYLYRRWENRSRRRR
ncbi:MAG: hypothetical protein ACXW1Y_08160 [Acidimicrobiia bacterium]